MSNTGAMLAYFLPDELANDLVAFAAKTMPSFAQPASGLHLTLAYFGEVANVNEAQRLVILAAIRELCEQVSPLQASINGIGRFVDHDPNAVIVNVDAPGLADLRARLLAVVRRAGIEPALDHGYTPHITLAYLPENEVMPSLEFTSRQCVIDRVTLTLGDERIECAMTGLKTLSEMTKVTKHAEMRIDAPTWEFRDEATFPVVPTSNKINLASLTHGDPAPVFVTRPLAILDAESRNGLVYNEPLFRGIYDQILDHGIPARRGHVAPDGKSSDFPPDEAYWIGAVIDDKVYGRPTVFGKAYIVPGTPLHSMVLRREAVGAPLSNSIYGDVTWAADDGGDFEPIAVRLETIDFVPAERASLQELGGKFALTSEMIGKEVPTMPEHEDAMQDVALFKSLLSRLTIREMYECMSEEQRSEMTSRHLQECTGEKVMEMAGDAHRSHMTETALREMSADKRKDIAEAYCKETGLKMGSETKQEDVAEMARMNTEVAEMQKTIKVMEATIKRYQRDEFERALDGAVDGYFEDWNIRTEDGRQKLTALKKNLRVLTVAEMAGSTEMTEISAAAEKAWVNVKPLAEMTLASLAGPTAIVGAPAPKRNIGYDTQTGRYDDEFVQRAKREFGVGGAK